MVAAQEDMNSSVSRYEDEDMNGKRHMYQVPKSDHIVFNVDQVQRGLGGAACGPAPLDQYTLKKGQTYSHTFRIVPINTNDTDTLMEKSNKNTQSSLPVKSILVNGEEISGFEVNKDSYEFKLLKGSYDKLPVVSVVTTDNKVVVEEFEQPDSLPAVVVIKATSSYGITKTYTITFREVDEMYVSDMDWTLDEGGYFANSRDVCDANPISLYVDGVVTNFAKGVGVHAPSRVGVNIAGKGYTNLKGIIGINSNQTSTAENRADVIFKVIADGEEIYNSGQMKALQSKEIDIDVTGKENIILNVDTNGADYNDHASWAELRFAVESTEVVDKTGLQEKYDEYVVYNENDYTPESWTIFKAALDNAEAVLANEQATQQQIDDALKALNDAINVLVIKEQANKLALQIAVEVADKVTDKDLENVVPAVVNEFKAALANAKAVLDDANATQEQADTAFDRLANAMHMLEFFKGNKTDLDKLVTQIESLNRADYSEVSWNAMLPVLDEAKDVLANENAMQEEVNETYTELIKAFLELRLKPNKDLLQELINKANGLNAADYTAKSWQALQKEVEKASKVVADPKADYETVEKAIESLKGSIEALEEKTPEVLDGKENAIKTGDSNNMSQLGVVMLLAGAAVVTLRRKKIEE